jgi:predicted acylesterase/phospholipase RssA
MKVMASLNSGRSAVILSGGGANGAFEVGAMKALFNGESPATGYTRLDPDIFTGTSVGAYNAAFMASRPETASFAMVGELEKVWLNNIATNPKNCGNGVFRFRGDPLPFFNVECLTNHPLELFTQLAADGAFFAQDWIRRAVNFFQSPGRIEHRTLALFDLSSFVSTEAFRQLIQDTLPLEGIRRSGKVLKIIATNWATGEIRIFAGEDMTDEIGDRVIAGSAAVPGFFPPVEIGGEPYVDGGVVMNTPLKPAIDAGADIIHMIYLDPDVANIPIQALQTTLDTLDRVLTIFFALSINEDIATADWINRGLQVIERAERGDILSDADVRSFIRVADRIQQRLKLSAPYRKITIHRYHPHEDLSGLLGLLNFDRNRIIGLIERGFKHAAEHECSASGCLLPSGVEH